MGTVPALCSGPTLPTAGGLVSLFMYGHKETTAQLYGEQKGPEGGGGTPCGDGETELNRPPIALPQSVNASHAELS